MTPVFYLYWYLLFLLLSAFIEVSLPACLSQSVFPGASGILRLSLQLGVDSAHAHTPHVNHTASGSHAVEVASLSTSLGTHGSTITLMPFDRTVFSSMVLQT